MHKNREVALVQSDGGCTIFAADFMPYNLWLEESDDLDARVNNKVNFDYWCASRVLTLDRAYAKEILNALGRTQAVTDRDRAAIAISYHALSLTDVYWVKERGSNITFDDINLYKHSLSGAFVDVCLRGRALTAQNAELITALDVAGDVSTQGVAPKAWIRKGEKFYLLKNGDIRDVEAELMASRVASCFKCDHIDYIADTYDGTAVSSSVLMTSLDRSIVPMEYIEIYAANHEISAIDLVLEKDAYSYYMMNIIDYLVGNTDRHWGNWGFWVDNDTNELLGLHPLMDFNKAFTSYDDLEGARCQTVDKARGYVSQKEAAIEAVRARGLNQIYEVPDEWFKDKFTRDMFNTRLDAISRKIQ